MLNERVLSLNNEDFSSKKILIKKFSFTAFKVGLSCLYLQLQSWRKIKILSKVKCSEN
jgi:hypothetical protein